MQEKIKDTYREQISIIERYKQGDKSVEQQLFLLYEGLIKKIAKKYKCSSVSEDDLLQAGNFGLLKGIEKFDASLCDNPEVYLRWYIDGEMKNELRKSVAPNIPRNVYYSIGKMRKARSLFETENGRLPNNSELATILRVEIKQIEDWCQAEQFIGPLSIDADNGEDDNSIIDELTDGKSTEDIYLSGSDTPSLFLEPIDNNLPDDSNEVINRIIEHPEYYAKQCGYEKEEFLQILESKLKKEGKRIDGSEAEKEKILCSIFYDTNFYLPFSDRLIGFIKQKRPELSNVRGIIDYLISQMETKCIPYLRESVDKWFCSEDIQKSGESSFRESMYKICFALELSVTECQHFFNQVVLDKAFYVRDVKEFVYYYCLKNDCSYQIAEELISQAIAVDSKERENHTLHETKIILESLVMSRSNEKLLEYINRNPQDFDIRNLTARSQIDALIADICIRDLEKDIIAKWQSLEKHIERVRSTQVGDDATSIDAKTKRNKIADLERQQEQLLKNVSQDASALFLEFCDNPGIIPKGSQVTTESSMLTMIYGFNIDKKKDVKNILSLGQQVIQRNLPNRQMRRKFTDEDYTYEYIRKTLIILASYIFWRLQETGRLEDEYEAWMNRLLLDNNLEELYEYNPFDWLMMKCANGKQPIKLFREITEEVV